MTLLHCESAPYAAPALKEVWSAVHQHKQAELCIAELRVQLVCSRANMEAVHFVRVT